MALRRSSRLIEKEIDKEAAEAAERERKKILNSLKDHSLPQVRAGRCQDEERDLPIFDICIKSQSEENIKSFLYACPHLDTKTAFLYLRKFKILSVAIERAKDAVIPNLSPGWLRPVYSNPFCFVPVPQPSDEKFKKGERASARPQLADDLLRVIAPERFISTALILRSLHPRDHAMIEYQPVPPVQQAHAIGPIVNPNQNLIAAPTSNENRLQRNQLDENLERPAHRYPLRNVQLNQGDAINNENGVQIEQAEDSGPARRTRSRAPDSGMEVVASEQPASNKYGTGRIRWVSPSQERSGRKRSVHKKVHFAVKEEEPEEQPAENPPEQAALEIDDHDPEEPTPRRSRSSQRIAQVTRMNQGQRNAIWAGTDCADEDDMSESESLNHRRRSNRVSAQTGFHSKTRGHMPNHVVAPVTMRNQSVNDHGESSGFVPPIQEMDPRERRRLERGRIAAEESTDADTADEGDMAGFESVRQKRRPRRYCTE